MHVLALSKEGDEDTVIADENDSIGLRDYLYYNDILYYGNPTEHLVQSFRMLDLTNGEPGLVTKEIFLEFFG